MTDKNLEGGGGCPTPLPSYLLPQEAAVLERLSELVNSLCTQLYYPMEHVAWAADEGLLTLDSTPIWTGAIILWALPLLITLIQHVKQLRTLRARLHQTKCRLSTSSEPAHTNDMQKLMNQQFTLLLGVVQTSCDLGLAVFWMPAGFLWAGKLPALWWGLLGTLSSCIGLYKTIKCQ